MNCSSNNNKCAVYCFHRFHSQIDDLYEDFHITKLPLLDHEVRGTKQVEAFSSLLLKPYRLGDPMP